MSREAWGTIRSSDLVTTNIPARAPVCVPHLTNTIDAKIVCVNLA